MVGLGRMGANMVLRLQRHGHDVVVHDADPDRLAEVARNAAGSAGSLPELVQGLERPRVIWIMLPAAVVGNVIDQLVPLLDEGDVVIDGGNSYYRDDVDRAAALASRGVRYVDVGVSGGVWGLERGYCLMIGGEADVVERLAPVFRALAPGVDAAPRTGGHDGPPSSAEQGYLHCGPAGAGHFVKMIHNGIEYGMMAAFAEGLAILEAADIGVREQAMDAETAPLADPHYYKYDLDVGAVAELWRRGSVVQSWLLDLTAAALAEDPELEAFQGRVSDSGEGRWTVLAAVEEGVPAHVISAALFDRFASRGNADFGNKVLAAMRKGFGGHHEKSGG